MFDQAEPRPSPASLPRVEVPQSPPPESPSNPGNSGLDELRTELRDGVVAMTRSSHPEDDDNIWLPKTQAETHDFIRQRLARHREFISRHHFA